MSITGRLRRAELAPNSNTKSGVCWRAAPIGISDRLLSDGHRASPVQKEGDVMKSPHVERQTRRITIISGFLPAIALMTACFCDPITAVADVIMPVVMTGPGNAERPSTEIAPGGTVILRGSRPTPDASEPVRERTSVGTPTPPTSIAVPSQGFDLNYNTGGFDRNFDSHGLTQPLTRP
jgi:hypothetical protein